MFCKNGAAWSAEWAIVLNGTCRATAEEQGKTRPGDTWDYAIGDVSASIANKTACGLCADSHQTRAHLLYLLCIESACLMLHECTAGKTRDVNVRAPWHVSLSSLSLAAGHSRPGVSLELSNGDNDAQNCGCMPQVWYFPANVGHGILGLSPIGCSYLAGAQVMAHVLCGS